MFFSWISKLMSDYINFTVWPAVKGVLCMELKPAAGLSNDSSSHPRTGDVQKQHAAVRALAVLSEGCHSVNPSGSVDVLYAVIGPAQVGVRDLNAVPEVQLDAGPGRLSLQTGGKCNKQKKKQNEMKQRVVLSPRLRSAHLSHTRCGSQSARLGDVS